jgi:hypothetical protein
MYLKLTGYTFPENKAEINVYAVSEENGILEEDCLALEFTKPEIEPITIYMRPDEALLVIQLLSQGLNRLVKSYEISPDPKLY